MSNPAGGLLRVPNTSIEVGRLGFGCARLFAGSELRASARLLEAALESGIRHFDTAPAYGTSEDVLGEVLAGVRDVTITTKVGNPRSETRSSLLARVYRRGIRPLLAYAPGVKAALFRVSRRPDARMSAAPVRRRLGRDEILANVDESRRRLRRDRIDILLVHEPDALVITDEAKATMAELQGAGVIGAFGLAWDRQVVDHPAFGQVVQARYDEDAKHAPPSFVRFFHGVLRHRGARDKDPTASAPELVRAALSRQPDAAVIFSASASRQIRDIAARSHS